MQLISEAIVAGSLESLKDDRRKLIEDRENRTLEAGAGNRAERRRIAAIERKKAKRAVGANT